MIFKGDTKLPAPCGPALPTGTGNQEEESGRDQKERGPSQRWERQNQIVKNFTHFYIFLAHVTLFLVGLGTNFE